MQIEENRLKKILFKRAVIILLLNIKDNTYGSKLARASNLTYSYVTNLLEEFEKIGLIERKIEGRNNTVFLTEKGKIIKKLLIQICENDTIRPDSKTIS